ncbi:MAG: IGHMBP2 family helicase [Planctomycetaceae bacterium]|nr:IGHMBP2 family helicase [Planctomycetaceae bacterium]
MRENHFERLLRWLQLEADAEAEQLRARAQRMSGAEAEKLGNTLIEMALDEETAGLGGRWLMTFCKRNRTLGLPWNRLGRGTPVVVAPEDTPDGPLLRGVVSDRTERTITIALPGVPDETDYPSWRIDYASDETARQRQRAALQLARSAERGRITQWRKLLLGEKTPTFRELPAAQRNIAVEPARALNDSQRAAIEFALTAENWAIIHGPPGTGKTTTLVEFIRRAAARGEKVLACAPSNMGVDNLLERLVAAGVRCVRLGHPARVSAGLREHTLDYIVENHPDMEVARTLLRDADKLFRKAGKFTRAKPARGEKQAIRAEARQLIGEARRMEQTIEDHLLDEADVVCATLTGLDDRILGEREFDWAVIDEAAQATEPPVWIPLPRAKKLVLAGDHCQLPATIVSQVAAGEGFGRSLMERLMEREAASHSRMLAVQYRMHEAIMGFSSREFYAGGLTADASVAGRVLTDLPGVAADDATTTPLEFIDTAGAGFDEAAAPDGESKFNEQEARLVVRKVRRLVEAGVDPAQIGVIAPYAAQVRLLREQLGDLPVEVDSVDGFQGREKEAIVVSLVRSNDSGEIGFLGDVRRMNVALTRAKRKLVVVGDSATLGGHPFYRDLLEYFEAAGAYHTVWEDPLD